MLVKQKEANRQSMILLEQADPSVQLLKALEDVANITKTLEQERLQHQEKVDHYYWVFCLCFSAFNLLTNNNNKKTFKFHTCTQAQQDTIGRICVSVQNQLSLLGM